MNKKNCKIRTWVNVTYSLPLTYSLALLLEFQVSLNVWRKEHSQSQQRMMFLTQYYKSLEKG